MGVLGGCVRSANSAARATPPSSVQIFYVATNGDDRWSGTLPAPNRKKTDGPLATVTAALNATRRDWENGVKKKRPSTILVRGGTYFSDPLMFYPEDSGLTIAAYQNEKPILSAGRRISNWREITVQNKKLWAADIPDVREGKWLFYELWVNGPRATRARHPNKGYFKIASMPDKTTDWTQGQTRFGFREGDIKGWPSITNAEAIALTRWVESRLPIMAVDETNHVVSFGRKAVFQLAPGDPYYMENAFEFLDSPGEWYLDAGSGTLYYWPRPGERLADLEAIAPVWPWIVRLQGQPSVASSVGTSTRHFLEHINFRGITFSHTEWYFFTDFKGGRGKPSNSPPPANQTGGFSQAAIGVPGAVWGEGVRGCSFGKCTFSHLGTYGLELEAGCASNIISHCEFFDLGAGGLKLGGPITDKQDDQTRANQIGDCHIHDGGKLFASAVGIWIGQSPDNRITHNLIHDFFYTGISVGWTWGYGPTVCSNNLIAFNHVHHIGVKSDGDGPILSDMGGIYTLGMQPGTKIINNLWHDIAGIQYGGWGIYFDEGSSGILAVSNVVYRTTHGGFHQHYGATNMVWNNIFAFGRDQQLQRTRPEAHPSFSFQTNIVYFDSGSLLAGDWSGDQYQMNWNIYFDARPGVKADAMRFAGATFDQWHQRGHDTNSLVLDPLFVGPERTELTLEPGSPAPRLGFRPIHLEAVGPRSRSAL